MKEEREETGRQNKEGGKEIQGLKKKVQSRTEVKKGMEEKVRRREEEGKTRKRKEIKDERKK